MSKSKFLGATSLMGLSLAALFPAAAYAQNVGTTDEAASQDEGFDDTQAEPTANSDLIVVTGSRIPRPELDSVVPVTTIDAETLTRSSNLQLGDALNDLPALRSTFGTSNSGRFIGTAGLSLLDLRGLGTDRTLVLVNGRRHVTSTPGEFSVDVSTIPVDLLERVDVVTGGQSATYGSDAIAGVVNFVLKQDFEGLRVRGQAGTSTYGDRGSYSLSAVAGKNFLDNRLNIAAAVEYTKQDPLYYRQRPYTGAFTGTPGFLTTDNTLGEPAAGDGIPDTTFFNGQPFGSTFGQISGTGTVQTSCPAANPASAAITTRRRLVCTGELSPTGGRLALNYFFSDDGSRLTRNNPYLDLRSVGGGILGGQGSSGVEDAQLQVGVERLAGNLLINLDLSPAFQPFFEGKFVRINAEQSSTQPTFVTGFLNPVFSVNNPYLSQQARNVLGTILPQAQYYPDGTLGLPTGENQFLLYRFNYDLGTRQEDHRRDTYRFVGGVRGDLSSTGNLSYEIAGSFGRTDTYYQTGGNILVDNFDRASVAVRNSAGNIVCGVNADADPTNDDPACAPANLFGFGNISQAAKDYILYTSTRKEYAEQIDATAVISGDSSGLFSLPGGNVGFAIGGEYRSERAFSGYDDVTKSGATFLNAIADFNPPLYTVKEVFGELRVPLLADITLINELTAEGGIRYSDYNYSGSVTAYNAGLTYSPFPGLRLRGGYARSVRAPNLSDLFATQSQTFANGLTDPCDQRFINENPNRAARCAEAGIPTTVTLPDGTTAPFTNQAGSGISGFNQGNPDLKPEIGKSFTLGAVFQPDFFRGFSLTVDYYDIKVENVIAGLSGQGIINRCYEDPVTIDNPFCKAVFRRAPTGNVFQDYAFDGQSDRVFQGFPQASFDAVGPAFLNQPFNYAALQTSGIDLDVSYRREFSEDFGLELRGLVSWVAERRQFNFITDPERATRVKSTLGDPEWEGNLSVGLRYQDFKFIYEGRYIGKQLIGAYETQKSYQGRPPENADAFPMLYYPDIYYNDVRMEFKASDDYNFYFGVDNLFNKLPPYGLTGSGDGSAIFSNTGRFFYAGFSADF